MKFKNSIIITGRLLLLSQIICITMAQSRTWIRTQTQTQKMLDSLQVRAKNRKFDQFCKYWGASVPIPLTDQGQIWHARVDPRSTLTCQISSESVYSVAQGEGGKNSKLYCNFNFLILRWLCPALLDEVPYGYPVHNYKCPHPAVPKLFLYSDAFMAKWNCRSKT